MSVPTSPALETVTRPVSPVLRYYFSRPQWAVYWLLLAVGITMRWWDLGARPLHHDESLHVMYSLYFWERPDSGYYRYDPMLHGPLLYNFVTLVFYTLGISFESSRAPIALFGSVFLFLPLVFRRRLSPRATLGLTAACALSPNLVYWSRFLREDFFVLIGLFTMLYAAVCSSEKRKGMCIIFGLVIQFCSKENAYVNVSILLGYLLFEHLIDFMFLQENRSLLRSMFRYIRHYYPQILFAFAVGAFFYVILYTSGFRHLGREASPSFIERYFGTILDALYRKSVGYWLNQHNIERIKGPFLFQFYMLAWYETAFVLAVLLQFYLFFKETYRACQIACALVAVAALGASLYHFSHPVEGTFIWDLFKLKSRLDLVGLFVLLFYSPLLTLHHLLRRERLLAFWGYLFTASFFSYSFVGEKVPWLAMYPLIAGLVYLALFFDDYFRRRPLPFGGQIPLGSLLIRLGQGIMLLALIFFYEEEVTQRSTWVVFFSGLILLLFGAAGRRLAVLGAVDLAKISFVFLSLFTLRVAILVNFVFPGEASELISQVHTTPEFDRIARRIRHEIESLERGYRARVLARDDATWPMGAYMIGIPEYQFTAPEEERGKFNYIFQNYTEPPPTPPPGYRMERINLRGWWLPEWEQMTLKNFLHYAINHIPWSPTGYTYCYFLTKEE